MTIIKIVDMKKCLDAVHFLIFFELKFVWKLVIYLHFRVTGKNWANLMAVLQKRGKNSSSLIENKSPKAHSSSKWIWVNCDAQQKLLHHINHFEKCADLRRFWGHCAKWRMGQKLILRTWQTSYVYLYKYLKTWGTSINDVRI